MLSLSHKCVCGMLQLQSSLSNLDLDFCAAPWRHGLLSTIVSKWCFLQVRSVRYFPIKRNDLQFTHATFFFLEQLQDYLLRVIKN